MVNIWIESNIYLEAPDHTNYQETCTEVTKKCVAYNTFSTLFIFSVGVVLSH